MIYVLMNVVLRYMRKACDVSTNLLLLHLTICVYVLVCEPELCETRFMYVNLGFSSENQGEGRVLRPLMSFRVILPSLSDLI